MTVTTTNSRISYTGDGSSVAFPFPYYFLAATDIEVFLNFVGQGGGFTVTGAGSPQGGTVTFTTAPAAGVTILLARVPDLLQGTDLPPNDPFPSDAVEKALDKLTMIAQELSANESYAVHFPLSEAIDGTLPLSGQRVNKVYAFDANGNPTLLPLPSSLGAGDLRWENGSDGTRGFKVNVDFTPNVTAQLTLSRSPINEANVWVYWDGVEQTDFTITAGNKVNFPTAIPTGISVVNVRVGTTLSLNVPAQGSVGANELASSAVTDVKVASNAGIQSSKLSFLQGGTGAVARTVQAKLQDVISVLDFGAKFDGVTDDTTAWLNAIAYLNSVGGGILRAPVGVSCISSTLTLSTNNVSIAGMGRGDNHDVGSAYSAATVLKWIGAGANPMIWLNPAGPQGIRGSSVTDIFLDCAGVASHGLRCSSVVNAQYRITGRNAVSWLIQFDSSPNVSEARDCQQNDIWVAGYQTSSAVGGLFYCDGDATSNFSFNRIHEIKGDHYNNAILVGNADNNDFYMIQLFRLPVSAEQGVRLWAAGNGGTCRANAFYRCSPGAGGFYSMGTESGGSTPAVNNKIIDYDTDNGPPVPVIGVGSTLWWGGDHAPVGHRSAWVLDQNLNQVVYSDGRTRYSGLSSSIGAGGNQVITFPTAFLTKAFAASLVPTSGNQGSVSISVNSITITNNGAGAATYYWSVEGI